MELNDILTAALKSGASDIHFKGGLPPIVRVNGNLAPLPEAPRLSPEELARFVLPLMSEAQRERFRRSCDVDLAYGIAGVGRFRANLFQQRGTLGAVFRVIPLTIATIEELGLPKVLEAIALESRGLILVTGATGAGKSTTLAALIDHINTHRTAHLLTIEDPVEFLIRDRRSIVNQREVGVDTGGFAPALRAALRQDPDVILVGEMRDVETIEVALTAAETGHLVMSTLHTIDATETVNRIVAAFQPHHQRAIRLQLASVLRAVISQRLVQRADGRGRVAALEILRMTAHTRQLIEDPERTRELSEAIASNASTLGTQTFDQALMALLTSGVVAYEEALRHTTNPDDFALRVSGIAQTSDSRWRDFEEGSLAPAAEMAAAPGPPRPPLRPAGRTPRQPASSVPPSAGAAAEQEGTAQPSVAAAEQEMLIERF
jgi:twitching motility protein PilT